MKKIFITGASSGIGAALVKAYAAHYRQETVTFGLLGRNAQALQQLAKLINSDFNANAKVYTVDVREAKAMQAAADDFMTAIGTPNIVIASAGVSRGTLTKHPEDIAAFQAVMDINVMGMVHTFSPFINTMAKQKQAQLVGIASVAGVRGLPGAGAYSASKAAAIKYLESLRVEMKPLNIDVTTVAPGYIRTPMTDINQYKMPFLMEADVFAQKFIKAIERKRRFVIIPWQMAWLSRLMRLVPPFLWDWIMRNAPHKQRTEWDWL